MEEIKRGKKSLLIVKKLGLFIGSIIILILVFKLAIYFLPFFLAGIIATIIEPVIKFLMNRFNISRRVSSSIIIILTIALIIGAIVWGGIFFINKLVEFLDDIGPLISNISSTFEIEIEKISFKLNQYLPDDVINMIITSITDFFSNAGLYLESVLNNILKFILSVPTLILNIVVTILALIFFTIDRIYILDVIEHHLPKKWMKNISDTINKMVTTLGSYIKAYGKIMVLTFAELFFAFSIVKALEFEIDNILVLSIGIALVDILPIFGVGTILIPWIIWRILAGDIRFAIVLSIIYVVVLTIRQLIEPKLVSKELGIHPLTTLFAMYAGFKFFGFSGLILGPIILIWGRKAF